MNDCRIGSFTNFDRVTMGVILLNCATLGMFRPCEDADPDNPCHSVRCLILNVTDKAIFFYFFVEMVPALLDITSAWSIRKRPHFQEEKLLFRCSRW